MAFAEEWIRSRCSSVRNGAGASSTSFWLRRCSEQSRVPTTMTLPWVSASTCASTCRGLSRKRSPKHSPRAEAGAGSRPAGCAPPRAKAGDGLAAGGVEHLRDFLLGAGPLQPAPAAAERRLDRDRQAVLL